MKRRKLLQFALGMLGALGSKSRRIPPTYPVLAQTFVGAWHLLTVGAPVLHHGVIFHSDGTICSFQAEGGFPSDSESNGAGQWTWMGKRQAQAAFLEFRASRETHEYLGYVRVELTVELSEDAQTLTGHAHTRIYDAQGILIANVYPTLSARRIAVH